MPRPCKRRRICQEPDCRRFGPKGVRNPDPESQITMTLDEFETIRLIDHENMTQEQCSAQMDVARTTVQAIYESARSKLALCLVGGKDLIIEGGDYVLCDGKASGCGCGHHCPHRCCMQDAGTLEEKTQ